ncbi:unnamed protein product [Staurois parvus]|uniref:Uncharacterized protein n=1 Tax=Staurois parvus TaxID=386267 RepID=A0ABN9FYZ8_9NEOB|nr:unnamed protein product [Staurois parvus]
MSNSLWSSGVPAADSVSLNHSLPCPQSHNHSRVSSAVSWSSPGYSVSRSLWSSPGHACMCPSLWSSPLCPQSLVIPRTVSAVSGDPPDCVRSLW